MNRETFIQTIDSLERVLENFSPVFVRERKPLKITGSYSIQQQEKELNIEQLCKTVRDMIADFTFYQDDRNHTTVLLKNTNRPNQMLLDGIQSKLEDYFFLECLLIDKKDVVYHFKDPLDLNAIEELIKKNQSAHNVRIEEIKSKKGMTFKGVYLEDNLVAKINEYNVIMPFTSLIEAGKLKQGFEATTGLVTRIHQDNLLDRDRRKVQLHKYQPIFKLLAPSVFEDNLSEVLKEIRRAALNNELEQYPVFVETKRSKLNLTKGKTYRLNINLPDHIDYIIVSPERKELCIGLGANLDYDRIKDWLKENNLLLDEEKKISSFKTVTIKKGGGSRTRSSGSIRTEHDVLAPNDDVLLTFKGDNLIRIKLDQEESFDSAIAVVSNVYYERMMYTGWMNTSELKTNLTVEERNVISSIDVLLKMYNLFLEIDEQTESFAQGRKYVKSLDWIYQKLNEVNGGFEERVLNVLNNFDARINPDTFYRFGSEEDTQEILRTNYKTLQKLKGSFEALVHARKAGLL